MSLWKDALRSLVGVSVFAPPEPLIGKGIDDPDTVRMRRQLGGQLALLPVTGTRWYLDDWEAAIGAADNGDLALAGALWRSVRGDGIFAGVLSTREGGVVALPKNFRGPDEYREVLEPSEEDATSIFDAQFPPAEIELLAGDGDGVGVGVGELCPVRGRDYPVFVRHDPGLLRYVWNEDQWYLRSALGMLPITPGDGRWVLHIPGGRIAPWNNGFWKAVTKSYILKTHAESYKANWEAKLANAARAAVSPTGATEGQRQSFFEKVMAWGLNTVFQLPPGWDVKVIEGNGRGHESFESTISRSDREYMIQVAGQILTTTGGEGFANGAVGERVESTLIQKTAGALAYTINTQMLPQFLARRWGLDALQKPLVMSYVVPSRDQTTAVNALLSAGTAIDKLGTSLRAYGKDLDIGEICRRFGIPTDVQYVPSEQKAQKLDIAPTDLAKCFRVDEVRASRGAAPLGDERGELTLAELDALSTSAAVDPVEEARDEVPD